MFKIIKEIERELEGEIEIKYFYVNGDDSVSADQIRVVGELNQQEVKIIALLNRLEDQIEKAHEESGFAESDDLHKKAIGKRNRLKSKALILAVLLWISILDRLEMWELAETEDDISLTKDFKIIIDTGRDNPSFFVALRRVDPEEV